MNRLRSDSPFPPFPIFPFTHGVTLRTGTYMKLLLFTYGTVQSVQIHVHSCAYNTSVLKLLVRTTYCFSRTALYRVCRYKYIRVHITRLYCHLFQYYFYCMSPKET
jgi:hypothetical protein